MEATQPAPSSQRSRTRSPLRARTHALRGKRSLCPRLPLRCPRPKRSLSPNIVFRAGLPSTSFAASLPQPAKEALGFVETCAGLSAAWPSLPAVAALSWCLPCRSLHGVLARLLAHARAYSLATRLCSPPLAYLRTCILAYSLTHTLTPLTHTHTHTLAHTHTHTHTHTHSLARSLSLSQERWHDIGDDSMCACSSSDAKQVAVGLLDATVKVISRGDLILIHANEHALSSQSPPSPPPPPPLAPPCHFILPGSATSCSLRRRQVSPPLTARLVFASCHWWRCRYACADASPRFRLAATSPSPRCSSCITMFQGMKGKFLLCRALHFASHRVMHSISLN